MRARCQRFASLTRALLTCVCLAAVLCGWARAAWAGSDQLRAKVIDHATPATMCAGEPRPVAITLLNTGEEAWDPAQSDHLAYHWRDAEGNDVVFDGERTVLPRRVLPGESVPLQARLVAPDVAGRLTLVWKLVRERVRWVPTDNGAASVIVEASERPPLALWVRAGEPDADVVAGSDFSTAVHVRNDGCAAWSPATGDNLAYHWYTLDGKTVVFDGRRTPMPSLPPGGEADVEATVTAPPTPGRYQLTWAMVREGLSWVETDAPAASVVLTVGQAPLSWGWAPIDPVPPLAVGEVATVRLNLTNTGTEAWTEEAGDRLGYHWLDADGKALPEEGLRTLLPAVVPPGQTVEVAARVAAPGVPGEFTLAWQPVREHVRWFGPPQVGPVPTTMTVTPARLAWAVEAIVPPTAIFVGRQTRVPVTITNVGADPWSEDTADHLSYRWLDATGAVVDEGMRTVLKQDVAPGQTVRMAMRLRGPPKPGRYRLQIEMVREHIAWFGAPAHGMATFAVAASRVAVGLSIAFIFVTIFAVALRRQHLATASAPGQRRLWIATRVGVPVWTILAIGLLGEVFVELGGAPLWDGGTKVAWSCAAAAGLAIAVVPRARMQAWSAAALVTFASALVIADLAYLDFFGSIVPLTALSAIHHLGDAHGTVSSLLSAEHAWLAALPVSGLILAVGLTADRTTLCPPRPRRWRLRIAIALCCALGVSPAARRLSKSLRGKLGARVFSQADNVGRFGLFGAHIFELARQVRDTVVAPEPPRGEALAALEAMLAERAQRRQAGTPVTGQARGYNLIVLQVEALSSWARGLVVDGQPITPFLDEAAASEAWLSLSVYDQTAQGRTSDAEYLALSSGHPLAEGALSFRHDGNDFFTLVHALKDRGYASLSAHPYSRGFWNRAVLHPRYGFDASMFRRELGPGPSVGWGLADGAFLERMVEPIAALPQPWVTFMITLSLHHPYEDFPDAMEELSLGALGETPVGNYLQAIRHFDSSMALFMEALTERGLADHTVVAMYGDHVTGIESRRAVWSLAGWDAWSPDLPMRIRQVPLMIWAPGVDAPTLDPDQSFGQIDIGPTVLDLLGVPAPPAMVGVSVAARGRTRPVVLPNGTAVGADRIFVGGGRDVPREGSCFDLPSGTTRPLTDCAALQTAAAEELSRSRAVVEHNLHRRVGGAGASD